MPLGKITREQRLRARSYQYGAPALSWIVFTTLSEFAGPDSLGVLPALGLGLAGALVVAAAVWLSGGGTGRHPLVKMAAQRMRVGRQVTDFSEIDTALVEGWRDGGRLDVFLEFGSSGSRLARVCLRSPLLPVLGHADRELVAQILRESSVQLPEVAHDRYDTTGRYDWMKRPSNLDRDQAIEYVLHTPEPLPGSYEEQMSIQLRAEAGRSGPSD